MVIVNGVPIELIGPSRRRVAEIVYATTKRAHQKQQVMRRLIWFVLHKCVSEQVCASARLPRVPRSASARAWAALS